ncbi:MAG: PEP-CTERM sorting domain-containing protein [Planctomycetota bacterium]
MIRTVLLAISWMVLLIAVVERTDAGVITIDFDDGIEDDPVDDFYNSLGVTFSNALFQSNFNVPGSSGTLAIGSIDSGFLPKSDSPIIATFDTPQNFVSITGLDVGANGIRINAYDAANGGSLVDFDEFIGIGFGTGFGPSFATISTTSSRILRVEVFQPLSILTEGAVFEDLTFQSAPAGVVPEPTSLVIFGIGAMGMVGVERRRKKKRITHSTNDNR